MLTLPSSELFIGTAANNSLEAGFQRGQELNRKSTIQIKFLFLERVHTALLGSLVAIQSPYRTAYARKNIALQW